ncbi:MAG TPA: beta-propeller fold lactonase family protein [Solirubrobacterales bacterium]|nr:beta-propeller fold lactonase family protein [Solirubrobacterales bacterium]
MTMATERVTGRSLSVVAIALITFAITTATALAVPGFLTQKADLAGCVSDDGTGGECRDGEALDEPVAIAASPDGKNVYVASEDSEAIAIFDRAGDGTLTQKVGVAGCISDDGSGGACQDGYGLERADAVVVSPDGENVYVAAHFEDVILTFNRDTATGELTQAGCIADELGDLGFCVQSDRGLRGPQGLAVSPDGQNVYVASETDNAVGVLDRDADGALSQKAGTAGCVADGGLGGDCQNGRTLITASEVVVSPDGANIYVASANPEPGGVAILDRGPGGALTQKAGTAGCISDDGSGSEDPGVCQDGRAILGVIDLAVSSDGKSVYTASPFSSAIAILDRGTGGALTQKAGTAGCISESGTAGACQDGFAVAAAEGVAVSPDGASVYATAPGFGFQAISVFDRDGSGALTQKTGTAKCVSEFGTADGVPGACQDGKGLDGVSDVIVSPDGTSVYSTSLSSDAIAIFERGEGAATDTTPPETQITKGPKQKSKSKKATFEFTGTDDVTAPAALSFECSLDGEPVASCSSPATFDKLKKGKHEFEVQARDQAGNTDASPASYDWKVKKKKK